MDIPALNKPRIALVEVYGPIGGAVKSKQFAPMFKALRESKHVRAVVLDIDSPGGAAGESDYLYTMVRTVAANKPVVAFIRGAGASGAYLLACAAERIVAQRSSIVGSIGVISIRPTVTELLEKIGVKVSVEATGPLKGMGLPFRDETPAEKAKNKALIDTFFNHFIDLVAEGRHVGHDVVRGWATGEVFWGKQAQENGLVDELGELEHAIAVAAKLGNVSEKNVVVARPHVGLSQRLIQRFTGSASAALRAEFERWAMPRIEYR